MDHQTSQVLRKISASVPEELKQNTTKTVVDTSQEELAQAALRSSDIDKGKKEIIAKALDDGKFREEITEINEEVVQKIDQFNENEIRYAQSHGLLADPKTDKFFMQRSERAERIATGQETPRKAPEISQEMKLEYARKMLRDTSRPIHKKYY